MSEIYRVCSHCGGRSSETTYRFCPTCGADSERELAVLDTSLAATASKAALPLAISVAGVALRFGWKLLQSRMAVSAVHNVSQLQLSGRKQSALPSAQKPRSGRRIHIRSKWAVGDSAGNWQRAESEHIIDIDDNSR